MSSLVQAVKSGSQREALEALRDKLAFSIENTDSGRDVAALSRRLMEVMRELDQLPSEDRAATKFEILKGKVGNGA